ncbi:aminotransferase DegT [bacterium F11]|nr:aminotransferase DegT [bacterium F11]
MEFIDLKTQQLPLRKDIEERLKKVLNHGKYIMGPEVKELETRLATYVGTPHCIGVSSGTDALLLALLALDIQPGDEVITPPFSFVAAAEMISLINAVPVFVDIKEDSYNLDPNKLTKKITKKTKAILSVDLYGQCADYETINKAAAEHNIPVIEDAAQSFGATQNGKKSGGLTHIGSTSFFPSKPLGCYGDGGACFTGDQELANKMEKIRVHGQEGRYNHTWVGINGRLDTLQAAVLLSKLDIFDDEVKKRSEIGAIYSRELKDYVIVPQITPGNTHIYAQYSIQVPDRSSFIQNLKKMNIPTAVHYPSPLHLQRAFAYLGNKKGDYPVSERVAEKIVSLPMHPYLSAEDQNAVINAVKKALS